MIAIVGGVSVGEEMSADVSEIAALQSIHPQSDVGRLLQMELKELTDTLQCARDLYHGGQALWNGRNGNRIERIREVLTLRARFARLRPEQLMAMRSREDSEDQAEYRTRRDERREKTRV